MTKCKPCCTEWWEAVQYGLFGSNWWKENLQMSQSTFSIAYNELCFHIAVALCRYICTLL